MASLRQAPIISVRVRAWSRVIQPLAAPVGEAVRAKPMAAIEAKEGVGQRSGARPVAGSVESQK